MPKVLIICKSVHHGNTMKIANVMAKELDADMVDPSNFDIKNISKYDIIGFGSGIYNGKHHRSLSKLLQQIGNKVQKDAFIFSTATVCYKKMHESLRNELIKKGFNIIGEFICKGFIDYSFLKYFFGGINKGRPNKEDLNNAKEFAKGLSK